MDDYSGLELVLRALREQKESIEAHVLSGDCETLEAYREKTGEIRGILRCEREILDMLERIEVS